jgi:hypothetical protein
MSFLRKDMNILPNTEPPFYALFYTNRTGEIISSILLIEFPSFVCAVQGELFLQSTSAPVEVVNLVDN